MGEILETSWRILALDGVGELIGESRPGFVVDGAGRRLFFANAAARRLLGLAESTGFGAAVDLDSRLADRVARVAARAAVGTETRELLRFFDGLRPTMLSVAFRRLAGEDAVLVRVDGSAAAPGDAAAEASLAPFVHDGGLVALFDVHGDVVAARGDHAVLADRQDEIEAMVDEGADPTLVLRTIVTGEAAHDVAFVRLGSSADARRLLWIGPARPAAPPVAAPTPAPATEPTDAAPVAFAHPPILALEPDYGADELDVAPAFDAAEPPTTEDEAVEETETILPAPVAATEPVAVALPPVDEDLFTAAPPLSLDFLTDDDDALDDTLVDAWRAAAPSAPLLDASVRPEAAVISTDTPDAPVESPLATIAENAAPDEILADSAPAALPAVVAEEPSAEPATSADADAFRFEPLARSVKFVWQMDADRRFTLISDEFAAAVGPAAADLVGRSWNDISTDFAIDDDGTIAGLLARRDTWSGRTVLWPIEGTALRLPVDLAALPAFGRGRVFSGFRGFGTVRAEAPLPDPRATGLRLGASAPVAAPLEVAPVAAPVEAPVAALAVAEPETPVVEAAPPIAEPVPAEAALSAEAVATARAEPPSFPDDVESAHADHGEPPEMEAAFAGEITETEPVEAPPLAADTETAVAPAPNAEPEERELGIVEPETILPETIEPELALLPPAPVASPSLSEPAAATAEPEIEPEPAIEPEAAVEPVRPSRREPAARLFAVEPSTAAADEAARLTAPERVAFRQIAEALGARLEGEAPSVPAAPAIEPPALAPTPGRRRTDRPRDAAAELAAAARTARAAVQLLPIDTRLLDRLPVAVAVVKDDTVVHANERFLALLKYPDLATFEAEGGIEALFAGEHVARRFETTESGRPMPVIARDGAVVPCEAVITSVPWNGAGAMMLTLRENVAAGSPAQAVAAPAPTAPLDAGGTAERIAELEAIVDTATDGVLMLDADGIVLSANTAAEALFGNERRAMIGRPLTERLAPESRRSASDYLDGLARNGVASVLNDGREVIGVVAPEGLIPLFMTIGRVSTGPVAKYCAVLRDITQWKKSEEDLTSARRRAEEASVHKSDFLAKISHEIRTPLNAIIGFSELMMDERFGPVGNERYKDYLRDIHVSGTHIMSLVNDLLDLSKVEAGKMDLRFEAVTLADIVSETVAMMQPQANRERIIIRSSLPVGVPPVVADPRSIRQVVINLLSNAIKFTPAGGQVIVSTTLEDNGEVVLRVRDTGYGMTDKEMQTAMEPFRQLHTTRSRTGGTGLGLPLTKALVEANRAVFRIDSTVGQGTLVSIAFPVTRVLAS